MYKKVQNPFIHTMLWRPRLVEGDALIEYEKGQHVLLSTGAHEFWVQVLGYVKRNIYIGLVCSRMHRFGELLEFKQNHVLALAY